MGTVEPDFAAPPKPVYNFFESPNAGRVDLPTVKAHRGPFVFRQATAWDYVIAGVRVRRRSVRYWFRSWWWPARIRELERQIAYLTHELDDWD